MSSAGRAASSSGCVARPRGRETGLTGYAEQIQRSLPTGSSAMETAKHREPYESRGSRTDLGAPGGESPPGDSTFSPIRCLVNHRLQSADTGRSTNYRGPAGFDPIADRPSPRRNRQPMCEIQAFRYFWPYRRLFRRVAHRHRQGLPGRVELGQFTFYLLDHVAAKRAERDVENGHHHHGAHQARAPQDAFEQQRPCGGAFPDGAGSPAT